MKINRIKSYSLDIIKFWNIGQMLCFYKGDKNWIEQLLINPWNVKE